jgi:hypothetical protein
MASNANINVFFIKTNMMKKLEWVFSKRHFKLWVEEGLFGVPFFMAK